MNYLFIIAIGAVAGWLGGQFVKGSEMGVGIDFAAGAAGSVVAVLLSRMFSAAASGMVVSVVIAIIGALGTLYAMRRFMKAKLVPAPKVRRRSY
ncbi:MAG TPA: GlsB/YeaQ/YmgE family stress response membrane protein [Thermoanaerobaculia bacterium]|jgi:uncharacterized membrane protein YeaQ/YmgE (transglycosylase-associated protein family)|nr:GlsB/YeaQ/YmgE family stress response membrane protein [Thermoanaerobaculia bacterium]